MKLIYTQKFPFLLRHKGITIDVQPSETGDEETQQHYTFSILIPSFDSTTHSLSYELDLCGCNGVSVPLTYTSFSDFDINGVLADGKYYIAVSVCDFWLM